MTQDKKKKKKPVLTGARPGEMQCILIFSYIELLFPVVYAVDFTRPVILFFLAVVIIEQTCEQKHEKKNNLHRLRCQKQMHTV